MVQAVCLPFGSKMLVIPIFLPMIPFIFLTVFPRKVIQDIPIGIWVFNPGSSSDLFPIRTFKSWGSTGDKQTSKGLFYYVTADRQDFTRISLISASAKFLFRALFFSLLTKVER